MLWFQSSAVFKFHSTNYMVSEVREIQSPLRWGIQLCCFFFYKAKVVRNLKTTLLWHLNITHAGMLRFLVIHSPTLHHPRHPSSHVSMILDKTSEPAPSCTSILGTSHVMKQARLNKSWSPAESRWAIFWPGIWQNKKMIFQDGNISLT